MPENVTKQTFEPYLNSTFIVRDETGTEHSLTLASIKEDTRSPALEQFSLIFHGSKEQYLPQDNHIFEHPQLGSLTMFAVPVVGLDPSVHHYQVVFSRLRPKQAL